MGPLDVCVCERERERESQRVKLLVDGLALVELFFMDGMK